MVDRALLPPRATLRRARAWVSAGMSAESCFYNNLRRVTRSRCINELVVYRLHYRRCAMRRFRLLTLFLFSASLIGFAQGRSGSSAAGSSSSSSAGSSHASGGSPSASSSSSHSGGGLSASAHSTHGGSDSASGGSKAASSSRAPHATRDSRSRLTSENLKSKPQQTMPAKLNRQQPTTKPHHWLARLFHHRQPELAKAPKPCVGKNCHPSTEAVSGEKLSATAAALRSGNGFEWTWRLCCHELRWQ
jgi:hypothetical protein